MKIIHFADLHLGVENYGRIDPATGLSTRLNDFLAAFDQLVDYALDNKIDLVLFCGDAYKSREPTQTQQREFARRIERLSTAGIPVFLLVGNHDMPNAAGRATATEIFDILKVHNVYVSGHPDINTIPTASGLVQIVTLPWLRRSTLLSREETRNLSIEEVDRNLEQTLTDIIASCAAKLDSALPAILAAHVWVTGAKVGSESSMSIGHEHTLLLSNVALPAFDYVALGHIHRQQVLSENPPVVYSGSLERVDFGEEKDEKGFYVVDIEFNEATGKRQVNFEFHPVETRRFLTINVDLKGDDLDPTSSVLRAINEKTSETDNAVVRLNVTMPAELERQLRDGDLRESLKDTHYYTISRDVQRETRLRLGDRTAEEIVPLDALKAYLETQNVPEECQKILMEYGKKLIEGEESI
jgi:exonuclease SbcD